MKRYILHDKVLTIKELSEMSGIAPATLRDRLRRGYTVEQAVRPSAVHESVEHFCEASWWEDWIGMSINDLYTIYWKWCIRTGYTTIQKQLFSRHLFQMYPNLKTVPTRIEDRCHRIIREK